MVCAVCYVKSQGATMKEAITVVGGHAVCEEHVAALATALDNLPDVTPLPT
jgi:hypothetical protein